MKINKLTAEQMESRKNAISTENSIEAKLRLCNVPKHEENEIMQMVYAYAKYMQNSGQTIILA